jgi:hypothetical protein
MPSNQVNIRSKLIDPALFQSGWSETHINLKKRPASAGQPQQSLAAFSISSASK